MQKNLLFGLLPFLLFSCRPGVVFDEMSELPESGWHSGVNPRFEVAVNDTAHHYELGIKLRINTDYPFSNIWLRVFTTNPEGKRDTARYQFVLATPEGKWTGSGIGGLRSYEFVAEPNKVFQKAGTYRFELEQYMRVDTLPFIHHAGIYLKKGEEVF